MFINFRCGYFLIYIFILGFLIPGSYTRIQAKTVEYDLTVDYQTVNYTGKDVTAMTVNGSIPGPTITFTEGDSAVIRVHNKMNVETSIHWHGLLLPNAMDGVPYITTVPIEPGKTHEFRFPIIQSGTYWYHSHTNLQEQKGVYGSIVIHPKSAVYPVDHDMVVVLSDWTDEEPMQVLRTLKRASEWYSIKKGNVQSWNKVIANRAIGARLKQSFGRMPPMDISDVYYDQFLVNGKPVLDVPEVLPGEKIRLRIINAAASSYFYFQFAGGPLQVVAADGLDVTPFTIERMLIAVAETYDVIITIPREGAFEFRATAQDVSGYASIIFGSGAPVAAPDIPRPNLIQMMKEMGGMKMEGMPGGHHMQGDSGAGPVKPDSNAHDHMPGMKMPAAAKPDSNAHDHMPGMKMPAAAKPDSNAHDHMPGMKMPAAPEMEPAGTFSYNLLRSPKPTTLAKENPVRTIRLALTGNMDRYIWSFNNKTLTETDKILIKRGENVRFEMVNKTMMSHPMHLHGHFFRVLNSQGEYSPLKHTVDVAPMETVVIEFYANEEKDWFFHCHILYHMMSGMARVVSYEGSEVDPALLKARQNMKEMQDDDWFYWGDLTGMSHANAGGILLSNNRNGLGGEWSANWNGSYEIEADYQRYFGRFLSIFAGGDFRDSGNRAVAGVRYLLPLYINGELRIDQEGEFRFQAGAETLLLPRLAAGWLANSDREWSVMGEVILSKSLSLAASYDSDYDFGGGLMIRW